MDRGRADQVHVQLQILVIANQVFPEAALPNAFLATALMTGRNMGGRRYMA
jgi:hypothetical protein